MALLILIGLVIGLGPLLTRIPLDFVQLVVGTLLLLFGLRWLRKAILRSAGVISLHDEGLAFEQETATLRSMSAERTHWDAIGIATAFKIVILEGIEVVFIVIAIGASGGLLVPASVGAGLALGLVIVLGVLLHRPLTRIPENSLKFTVGVLLSAFGTFWAGEGIGIAWPGGDWSILALAAGFFAVALLTVTAARALSLRLAAKR